MPHTRPLSEVVCANEFISRHLGPDQHDIALMLDALGLRDLDELIGKTVPESIRSAKSLALANPVSEHDALDELHALAKKNRIFKSYLGQGYHDCYTPNVILRNVLENPGWYTAYTPYQAEISQGRLEALLNYQQMIIELSGLDMANASMLDEATAAAEAMAMAKRVNAKNTSRTLFVDRDTYPQTLAVLQTRAKFFGFEIQLGSAEDDLESAEFFAAYVQYSSDTGKLSQLQQFADCCHRKNALLIVGADLLSLVLLRAPGHLGADIVVGSNQRFGIPMGFGGPHAGFFAFKDEHKRNAPGRIIGVSVDKRGKRALRMAMQTREQHIRREKANSNICTSQVLLAVISAFYAMYHGNDGLKRIAERVHLLTKILALGLTKQDYALRHSEYFDTLCIEVGDRQQRIVENAEEKCINLRKVGKTALCVSINECTTLADLAELLKIFSGSFAGDFAALESKAVEARTIPADLFREGPALEHEIFERYHSETEMLRYMKRLESRDIALNQSMIPLGSCTMKLNAVAEMIPVTWPEFSRLHPFAPIEQADGYVHLFEQLQEMLKACTGYDAISLQPNAGSQGEYAGLLVIRNYFASRNETQRKICLIPSSAHGTNPASAQMAGLQVVVTKCDIQGNVDLDDLTQKVAQYGDAIACIMLTYPSTHGVFEEQIRRVCELIHSVGAQVYIDGANLNAMVGVAAPGEFGGDVSHLNLHKTFCIPHGGGGPGMGPIGVKKHLAAFLPSHPLQNIEGTRADNGTISAAPWGSASILPISWMYIRMMGAVGLRLATQVAILNANYVARRLRNYYPVLYSGAQGFVAHECLLDLRPLKSSSGVSEEDIAKRLMDFGFHAPTMSFPVAGTLMIEPTESESKAELDRFCDAMIKIREEIDAIQRGDFPADDNPLVNAPHTLDDALGEWSHPYSRDDACRPLSYLHQHKYWPYVNRIDNVYGDRNVVCSCPPVDAYL